MPENRHLNDLAESIAMNVGGPCVEGSSPPMKHTGVGGPIVVRGRESRPQGEGGQGIDVSRVDISGHMPVKSGATRYTVARYGSGGGRL